MGPADNSAPGYIGSVSRTNDRHAAGISAYDRGGGGADSYPPQATRRGLFDQSVMGPSAYDSRDHYGKQHGGYSLVFSPGIYAHFMENHNIIGFIFSRSIYATVIISQQRI